MSQSTPNISQLSRIRLLLTVFLTASLRLFCTTKLFGRVGLVTFFLFAFLFSSQVSWGQYPVVAATNANSDTGNDTSHSVDLPAGIQSGDLLLIFWADRERTSTVTTPTGWTVLYSQTHGSDRRAICYYRIADGTEGSTVTITSSGNLRTAHNTYRISAGTYTGIPVAGTPSTGNNEYPNPPNLTSGFGAVPTLWIAAAHAGSNSTYSYIPDNYTDLVEVSTGGQTDNDDRYATMGTVRRTTSAVSENPNTFTISQGSQDWCANTVAIQGAELTSPYTMTSSGTFTVPAGVTSITVEAWGGGGGGAGDASSGNIGNGGGGGGAYARVNSFAVTPGTTYSVVIGSGGAGGGANNGVGANGGTSSFNGTTCVAVGGSGGQVNSSGGSGGSGGLATSSTGDVKFSGGNGAAGGSFNGGSGGGGGSSAGSANNGNNGNQRNGGAAVLNGGAGGDGGTNNSGLSGGTPGGGGGGGEYSGSNHSGGAGADGQVIITWSTEPTGVSYCEPSVSNSLRYINRVRIGDIDNLPAGTGFTNGGYGDYTSLSTDLTLGETGVSITLDVYSNTTYGLQAWVDWDQDGEFTQVNDNIVCDYGMPNNGNNQRTYSFDVPSDAKSGATRMRIRLIYDSNSCSDPCSDFSYGEVEDYTVNVVDLCDLSSFDGAAILASENPVCSDDEFTLSIDAADNPDVAYNWQSSADGTNWTDLSSNFFESDFSSLPANSAVYGAASVAGGELILTSAQNSLYGGFVISDTPGEDKNDVSISFDYRIWDGSGADGFSLSYGPDIANSQGSGETGEGSGLRVCFDTYDNSTDRTNSQVYIYYNNTPVWQNSVGAFNLRNSSYRQVDIGINESGELTLSIGGTVIVSGLSLSGYTTTNKSDWKFKFSARTGGLNDKHSIDNLTITYSDGSSYTTTQTETTFYRAVVSCGGTSVNTADLQVLTPVIHTNPISIVP